MESIKKKRFTRKKKTPNPLFEKWLKELYNQVKESNSNSQYTIKLALTSLQKYPVQLQKGTECAILKGFGPKLCSYLNERLEQHLNNCPQSSQVNSVQSSSEQKRKTLINEIGSRNYLPVYRSGAYAILRVMLENFESDKNLEQLTREQIMALGQQYADESFQNPKAGSRYTSWSSMSTLLKKDLVKKMGIRNATYILTNEGYELALLLREKYANALSKNDLLIKMVNLPTIQTMPGIENEAVESKIIPDSGEKVLVEALSKESSFTSQCGDEKFELEAGTFDVILLVDKQETKGNRKEDVTTQQLKKYTNLRYDSRHLKVGDFLWIAKSRTTNVELVLPFIVERKRMDDFAYSIKDGRFHEQKFRLRKSGIKNVIYLVEDYGSNKHVGLPMQSLLQAMVNTRVQNDFKIHVTDSLVGSIRFLAMMSKKLYLDYKDQNLHGCSGNPSQDELMSLDYFNKAFSKTKALSVTETFIKLLLQIKGMSVEKALAITKEYKTPKSFMDACKLNEGKNGEMLLSSLKYGNFGKNVGPKLSLSVFQLFSLKEFQ